MVAGLHTVGLAIEKEDEALQLGRRPALDEQRSGLKTAKRDFIMSGYGGTVTFAH
jgi:hypothetical protein